VAVTALLLCTSLTTANAAGTAQTTSAPAAVSSGSWGAVATTRGSAPYGTAPLALTFTVLGADRQYFNVVNTGTLPLIGQTFTATTTAGSAAIEACSTAWNESTGSCPSGIITTVTTTGVGPKSFAAPLPTAGSAIRLRANKTSGLLSFTVTVGVSVARTQVRMASTTGS
jgi:hypothetical protein